MELQWLELRDVRPWVETMFEPTSGVNLVIGDNGAGKTTLLEAVGYLATLQSFRGSPDASLVRTGTPAAVIRGAFRRASGEVKIEVEIPAEGRRRVLMNGKRVSGRAEVAAEIAVVAFLPDDLDLVKRGPAYRRDYVDDLVAGLWPTAAGERQEYERALRQRNALLRKEGRRADLVTLDVWDERLASLGAAVITRRMGALDRLGPVLDDLVTELGGGSGVTWRYESSALGPVDDVEDLRRRLADAIAQARETDLERRTTTVGPHRDEVVLGLAGRDVRTRASQGEQRSVALGLRVAAFHLIREQRRTVPVLLLDDVFSELDEGRSRRLVERLPDGQVFVSSARVEDVPVSGAVWEIVDGSLRRTS